eukprot:scaffold5475_cov127-Isochrysis_galbana.AAC.13
MGDPAQYPEVRMARFLYAMQWLPPDFRADYQARQQWIDNNLTYLDGLAIANLHYHDADFRRVCSPGGVRMHGDRFEARRRRFARTPRLCPYGIRLISDAASLPPIVALVPRRVWPFHSHGHHP